MTLNDYQTETKKTAIYPQTNRGGLNYTLIGLANETGELLGHWKKFIRDGGDIAHLEEAMAQECGDILWYLSQTATEMGYSLEDIAQINLDKLASRQARGVLQGSGDGR